MLNITNLCCFDNKTKLYQDGSVYVLVYTDDNGKDEIVGRYTLLLDAVCGYVNFSLFEFGRIKSGDSVNLLIEEIKKLNNSIQECVNVDRSLIKDPVELEILRNTDLGRRE